MCTVIAHLTERQLEIFGLNGAFPAIFTDCGANMRKVFNNILQWDWLHCGCHLIHNVVTACFTTLRNNAHNPAQTEARKCPQSLDRWKCESLPPSALSFFTCVKKYLKLGIRYLHWLDRVRSFVYHLRRSSKASKDCGHYENNRCLRTPIKAATRPQTPRKTRKKRMRGIQRVHMPIRSV